MSAEILRRAAALMRDRAEAAGTEWPWYEAADMAEAVEPFADGYSEPAADGAHIASWRPAVALAVSKLLDDTAETWEMCDADAGFRRGAYTVVVGYTREYALAVARAYLGDDA